MADGDIASKGEAASLAGVRIELSPGPWQIRSDYLREDELTIIANVDGEYIDGQAHCTYDTIARCIDEYGESLPNAELNARAIVALPDLIKALQPFARIAENDISMDEAASDIYRPMSSHNRAPLITVGDMRRAMMALAKAIGGAA